MSSYAVGHCQWRLKIYPYGKSSSDAGWVSVYLELHDSYLHDGETVMAQFSISLLDRVGEPVPLYSKNSRTLLAFASKQENGYPRFIPGYVVKRYLREDDSFRLKFQVVVHNMYGRPTRAPKTVVVPPSGLPRHLLDLLRSKRGADVTFEVGGELFVAHRCILAARSSVFMAALFGPMAESATPTARVRVDDMEPRVFEAMLEFIYTDDWPAEVVDPTSDNKVEMAQHLLVAADRYLLDRLKLTCEAMLCDTIDRRTVANVMTLAEQHGCRGLKEACFNFLHRLPGNLEAVMASEGYQHMEASCPSLVKEIMNQATAMSGSHVLEIDGYYRATGLLRNGGSVMSIMFAAGGCRWRIQYYPDGHSSGDAGWISMFLVLCDDDGDNGATVQARYQISLLDLDGNPVEWCRIGSGGTPVEFPGQGRGGTLVQRKMLEVCGCLKRDGFRVRCDITVVGSPAPATTLQDQEMSDGGMELKQERPKRIVQPNRKYVSDDWTR
jgi:speckle-type POZ protein